MLKVSLQIFKNFSAYKIKEFMQQIYSSHDGVVKSTNLCQKINNIGSHKLKLVTTHYQSLDILYSIFLVLFPQNHRRRATEMTSRLMIVLPSQQLLQFAFPEAFNAHQMIFLLDIELVMSSRNDAIVF